MKFVKVLLIIGFTMVMFPMSVFGDSLMGHWRFSEGGGDTAYDASGNGNHGAIFGAVPTEDRFGNPNSAYSFDGINDHILIARDLTLEPSDSITIEAWIYPTDVERSEPQNFIDKYEYKGYFLRLWERKVGFGLNTGEPTGFTCVQCTTNLNNNEWYHIVGTYDGIVMKIFVNSTEEDTLFISGSIGHCDIPLGIGAALYYNSGSYNYFFEGIIDEVKILDDAVPPPPPLICNLPSMDNIIEGQEQCYNHEPCYSNFGFDALCGLDDGWYQIDSHSGNWSQLFTDVPGKSWFGNGWCLPESSFSPLYDGSHIIFFKASDDSGNVEGESGEWSWQFYKDTTPPNPPDGVISPSHDLGIWSNDNTVDVTWIDATDLPEGCGVDGYYTVWDTMEFTIPDSSDSADYIPVGVGVTMSPPLSDGRNHYFHMKTKDEAGNWIDSTVHIGPFCIDVTPPVFTIDCEDTVQSVEDPCFHFFGEENLTPQRELLYSYWRISKDPFYSDTLLIDSICWEDLAEGGPYTLWVECFDLAGNVQFEECEFYYFPPPCDTSNKGDVTYDCKINVLDILMVANIILEIIIPDEGEVWRADCNGPHQTCDGDGKVNVLDAVKIANIILLLDQCP